MSNTVELKEHIVVDGAGAEASLSRITGAAMRVAKSFEGITEVAGMLGGIGGLWKVAETVGEVDNLYKAVGRVKAITGMTAQNAHAMFSMFELSGIEMEGTEKIMISMARLSGKLGDGVTESAEQAAKLDSVMARLGVSVKAGPIERLMEMAKAAQTGKLKINDLIAGFTIPRSQAAAMMSMLSQGPARLKQIQEETLDGAAVINDKALANYEQMLQIRRNLKESWKDLVGVFYKGLVPAIMVILQKIADGFKAIEPIASRIGKALADHMEIVVHLTKTYIGLLIANKAIGMFGGGKMGLGERASGLFGGAMGFLKNRGAVAISGPVTADAAAAGARGLGMMAAGGGEASILGRIMGSFAGRIGIVGILALGLVNAFHRISDNTDGIRTKLLSLWSSIVGHVMRIYEALRPLLEMIAKVVGVIASVFGEVFVDTVQLLMTALDGFLAAMGWLINGLISIINALNPFGDIDKIDSAKRDVEGGKKGTEASKGDSVNQDFRGSKFEITNNFPQGVDGGRVAVAFGDELAALGERRIDSGLRPLYSYR